MAFEYQAFATLGVNLNRQKYAPLDISQVFKSQADLDYYTSKGALTTGVSEYWYKDETSKIVPYPYPGQIVALVIEREVTLYVLAEKEDGTFATNPVGSAGIGDGATIVVEGGKISLAGLSGATDPTKKYQPVLIDGQLTWQEVSTTTIEGLDTSIKAAEKDIENLQDQLGVVPENTTVVELIETTKTEVINTILGETVNADFDTLQEVAEWIASDTTNSAELIRRVTAIEDDYLKSADKDALQGKIDDLVEFVGQLPEGAVSTTVIGYIHEVVDALQIGDYAKADDLTKLGNSVKELEDVVSGLPGQITALTDRVVAVETGKVDKVEGSRLMTDEEGNKLQDLPIVSGFSSEFVIDEETKQVSIHEITYTKIAGLSEILNQKIAEIHVDGVALTVTEGKVELPIAGTGLGLVRTNEVENGVIVAEDGTMTVHSLNINKLVQTDGDWLVLDGGDSTERNS
ncbi:MAG: hypothetical protein PUF04_09355 [bacterium]|nr:hypothetical protein [bacterium]